MSELNMARDAFQGVPTFFRCCCLEASQGGKSTYGNAAWHLVSAVGTLQPDELETDEWGDRVDELLEFARQENEVGVLGWLDRHYPRCMELVPRRRRGSFAGGVFQAYEADRIGI